MPDNHSSETEPRRGELPKIETSRAKLLKSPELEKLVFEATLCEYASLKSEILGKFQDQIRIYALLLAAMGGITGYVLTGKSQDMLLILPLISDSLASRYFWEQSNIIEIGNYLKRLEYEVFPKLIGYRGDDSEHTDETKNYWICWENYFRKNCSDHKFYKLTIFLLFIFLPNLISISYSMAVIAEQTNILNIFKFFSIQPVSYMPLMLHISLVIIYMSIGIYFTYRFTRLDFLGKSYTKIVE